MKLLYGRKIAKKIRAQTKKKIQKLGLKPGLAIILVGNNPASKLYVGLKQKACREVGIKLFLYKFNSNITGKKIIDLINELNLNKKVNGILVQLPLPEKLPTDKIIQSIDPKKDPDFFHPVNLQKIKKGQITLFPPTLSGVLTLLKKTKVRFTGKNIVIISKSKIFAEPLVISLKQKKARVVVIKPSAKNINRATQKADIIISAIGKKWSIKPDMIKENSIFIDIGCTKINKKSYGDAHPDVKQKTAYFTPVPGGVGPLTVAYLVKNVLELTKIQDKQ